MKAVALIVLLLFSPAVFAGENDGIPTYFNAHEFKEAKNRYEKFVKDLRILKADNADRWMEISKKMIVETIELENTPRSHSLFEKDPDYNFSVLVCAKAVNSFMVIPFPILGDCTERSAKILESGLTEEEKAVAESTLKTIVDREKELRAALRTLYSQNP